MKTCEKCNKEFESFEIINGVRKNLQNRRFCLGCSPWGRHNTKKLDTLLVDRKRCSRCKDIKHLSAFRHKENRYDSWCKRCLYDSQMERWKSKKAQFIELKGGKCMMCGYDKNYASLVFHHKDKKTKDYSWNKLRLRSDEDINKELDKCVVVCSNCHGEIHNKDLTKT